MRSVCLLMLALISAGPMAMTANGQAASGVDAADLLFLGEPAGAPLTGAALTQRTTEVASLMRCPVCQGLSIGDSPTPLAVAMKDKVEGLLAAGYSEKQVLTLFEASYGEFIRLSPKPEGFNLVVWVLPGVMIAIGLLLVLKRVRSAPLEDGAELEAYRQRVREEVER